MKTFQHYLNCPMGLLRPIRVAGLVCLSAVGWPVVLLSHPNHFAAQTMPLRGAERSSPAVGQPAMQADARLSVTIVDAKLGQPTPVRVRITDENGEPLGLAKAPRFPPSLAAAVTRLAAPGSVPGLPTEAIGVMYGPSDEAGGYAFQPDGAFYVNGSFDLPVPAGKWTLKLSKGYEFVRETETLLVQSGDRVARTYELRRWIDMPERGWYSADDHIHLRRSPRKDPVIRDWIAAEDVHVCLMSAVATGQPPAKDEAKGPLRVHPTNPRYFTDGTKNADGSLRAVYLTGSHTWDIFQRWAEGTKGNKEMIIGGRPADFSTYLDVLQNHNHNLIRLWVADTAWSLITKAAIEPQPYVRTGPGKAADGGLKFNLDRLNQAYFDELRSRVIAARDRGIYVAVMLFDGWGISEYREAPHDTTWNYHPFNGTNNVNGIHGDPNNDGIGLEYHTLQIPAIKTLQETYVRKVVDTVNDLDNVLYEICNESGDYSTAWQYHLISFIKSYEATKSKQHPVGMTYQYSDLGSGTNATLFNSPADWISPGVRPTYWDPPAADGSKVIIPDTDHFNSKSWDATWVWRSFMRGLNPIVMDWWNGTHWDPIRRAMGHTRMYATKMDLSDMTPSPTGYCLSNSGSKYLVYQPISESTIILNLAAGTYDFEWFDPGAGKINKTGSISIKAGNRSFTAPFKGEVVLYVTRSHQPLPGPTP